MISIKSNREIELMKHAGYINYLTHEEVKKHIKVGITTKELDKIAYDFIAKNDCIPSFLNYQGFPGTICASINDVVVHGIPGNTKLKNGDIISIDIGVAYQGYHSDAARTHAVGTISDDAKKLIEVTRQSFFEGIKFAKAGHHLHEISAAIGNYAESFGYGVVTDLVGHGIGTSLHEDPQIPNFPQKRRGIRLVPGMTLAIEPMITMGRPEVVWLDDDWTVVSEDGSLAAHYENTVLITDGEPELLTLTK